MGEAGASVKGRGGKAAVAAAFALGVTICATAPCFVGVAGEVAAGLVR